MTTETAAEMLYDEYTGTTGRFQTSTQKDRWLAFARKVVEEARTPDPSRWASDDAFTLGGDTIDESAEQTCDSTGPHGFWCTRPIDHPGPHAAGDGTKYLEVWKDARATELEREDA